MASITSARKLSGTVLFFYIAYLLLAPLGPQPLTSSADKPKPAGLDSIGVGSRPAGVAVDPKNDRAAVANRDSNSLSIIDLAKREITTIAVGNQPEGVAIKPAQGPNDTTLAVVANGGDGTISVVSLDDMEVSYTLKVGKGPYGVAINPRTTSAVVSNSGSNNVSVVDLSSGEILATIDVDENPHGVAINTTTNTAVVANRSGNTVSIIDLNKNQVIELIEVDIEPEGVAINPEIGMSGFAAVTHRTEKGGQVTLINLEDFTIGLRIDVDPEPMGIAINTVTNLAVVAHKKPNSVSLIDLAEGNVIDSLAVGREPLGAAVHPDINQALVTDNGSGNNAQGTLELIQLAYPVPSIGQLAPENVVAGSPDLALTINGNKFFRGSAVSFDRMPLETTFINSHQLQVRVPAALIGQAKTVEVAVTNPEPQGGTSPPARFAINNPVPRIEQITPTERTAGDPDFELTVRGSGFVSGSGGNSVIKFGGTDLATTFASATQLRARVPAVLIAQARTIPVTIFNPPPGGGTSNAVNFTANTPQVRVRITAMTPVRAPVGAVVTITGENFSPVAANNIVTFAGPDSTRIRATITSASTTQIVTTVPAGAVSGPVQVRRDTFDSNGFIFNVLVMQDYSLSISPATAAVIRSSSVTYQVAATGTNGFSGVISLSLRGVPTGATATFDPPSLTAGQSSTLTISASNTATTGQATLTISGQALLNGAQVTKTVTATLNVQPAGVTALVGRVLSSENVPIPGVRMAIGSRTTLTDGSGNFLIMDPPRGEQDLITDGRTASTPTVTYPVVPVVVNIVAGRINELGFIIYLPKIDISTTTPITPSRDTMITSPAIPDLEVIIPAGTTIRMPDGTPVTSVSVTGVPVDRAPMPPPPGARVTGGMLFTLQPGGAIPSRPIPIRFPNTINLLPGERANLYYFDHHIGDWRIYGTGTVSADGRCIVSDPGVGLPDFAWHFPSCATCPPPGRSPGCPQGDPVDPATGLFFFDSIDVNLPGRIPAFIERKYRTQSSTPGSFGIGTTTNYDYIMLTVFAVSGGPAFFVDPDGNRFRFNRQPDGTFITSDRPEYIGAKLTVNRDGSSNLRFKDGLTYSFDPSGPLARITDRNNNTLTLIRDGRGNLVRVTEPAGRSLLLAYDSAGRVASITDPIGRTVTYTYNSSGTLSEFRDQAGNSTRYNYDTNNRMAEIIDARGNLALRNTYDAQNRVIRQEQADGGIFTYNYVSMGGSVLETTITLPDGGVSKSRFNPSGFTIEQNNTACCTGGALRASTQRAPGTNLVTSITDVLGRRMSFRYDNAGNTTTFTDAASHDALYEYEPQFNNVTRTTDALGNISTFSYDARGNLIRSTDPLGNTTVLEYDSFGQLISHTDPLGNRMQFTYDDFGNLVKTIDPLGNANDVSYDLMSRITRTTDFNGRGRSTRYDALNRIVEQQDALGNRTSFTYDPNGNITAFTDPNSHTITNTYDVRDRLTRKTDPLGMIESSTYNQRDRLIRSVDRRGQATSESYNQINQVTVTTFADGSTIEHTYDAIGRKIRLNDSSSGSIEYTYDARDNLIEERTPQGTVSYSYDQLRRRVRMLASGQAEPVLYSYDAASRLTEIRQGPDVVAFTYDAAGRITVIRLPNGIETAYTYDRASRITNITYRNGSATLEAIDYTHDSDGNRQTTTSRSALTNRQPVSATYDAANRLLTFGEKRFTYDASGNLTSATDRQGVTNYVWDARNRLIAINGPGLAATFTYDAIGRRASKTINGQTTRYLYDVQNNIVQEFGADTVSYLVGLQMDQRFSRSDRNGKTYYLSDALNSTIFLTNSSGAITARYFYDAFGNTTSDPPTAIAFQPFQYTGRENDNTGLYYYRVRYYDPQTGRFISEDPIGLAAGVNFYAYVDDNPINHMDPYGLDWLQDLSDFSAGWGDALTTVPFTNWSLTRQVRQWMGTNDVVNKCSGWYRGGSFIGTVHQMALPAGWALRPFTAARQAITHWNTAARIANIGTNGLRPGSWVMTGGGTIRNFLFAGGNPLPWNLFGKAALPYKFADRVTMTVPGSALKWPRGWEWFKGFLGQRIYAP